MYTVVDEYKISYKEVGFGNDVVVILQGWGTNMSMYDSVANCISSKYRIIQFDFPGFGDSQEPKTAWSVSEYSNFVLKFFAHLNIKKATLIGHSFGGRVIIKLACDRNLPFEINRIVLIDSAGIKPKMTFCKKARIMGYKILNKIFSTGKIYKLFPQMIERWKNKQGSADYRNATPIMKQCLVKAVNEDLTECLPYITQETLLIWGEKDTATPLEDAKLMEKMIKNSGLAVIEGVGHFCFLENKFVFQKIMESFFKIEEV